MSHVAIGRLDGHVRRPARAAGVGAVGVLVGLLPACGPTPEQRYEERLANTGKPAMHAVTSDRLREIMDQLTYHPITTESDVAGGRQQQLQELSKVAARMSEAANNIPDAIRGVELSERDREVFLQLVAKFSRQSKELSDAAGRGSYDAARRKLEQVQSTCNACHSLFRNEPGAPPA